MASQTIDKMAAREKLRQMVYAQMAPLIDAQISNARGIKYLVVRDKKTGKFERVTEAFAKQATSEDTIEVWEKDPSIAAFSDLMNRALDMPAKHESDPSDLQVNVTFGWAKPPSE